MRRAAASAPNRAPQPIQKIPTASIVVRGGTEFLQAQRERIGFQKFNFYHGSLGRPPKLLGHLKLPRLLVAIHTLPFLGPSINQAQYSLYHYCSMESFLSMLKSKEIWLSLVEYSNDSKEGYHLIDFCKNIWVENGISGSVIEKCTEMLNDSIKETSAFSFSVCEEWDSLLHWGFYADGGRGVSVGISRDFLSSVCDNSMKDNTRYTICKVQYWGNDDLSEINDMALEMAKLVSGDKDAIRDAVESGLCNTKTFSQDEIVNNCIYMNLVLIRNYAYQIKSSYFSNEKKWRIFKFADKNNLENFIIGERNIDFTMKNGKIVPHLKLRIEDSELFTKIFIGPNNENDESIISSALRNFGFYKAKVERAQISYR